MNYTAEVIAVMAVLLTIATVAVYERHLQRLRWELDEAIADADLAVDLMRQHAKQRHPSATYGGGNLRVVR